MNDARVYIGQHFDDDTLDRAIRDVRVQGYHDFEAQVVITVTFHRLSPTADSSNGYVSTFVFHYRVWILPYRSSAPLFLYMRTREGCSLGLQVLLYI